MSRSDRQITSGNGLPVAFPALTLLRPADSFPSAETPLYT
jgi:hypothetical protein